MSSIDMPPDLEIIKQLQDEIGAELHETAGEPKYQKKAFQTDQHDRILILSLQGIDIKRFPQSLIQLKNLNKLDLSNTQLQDIPAEIAQLKYLKSLNLSSTKLRKLPAELGLLEKLTSLELTNTPLKSLPNKIGHLRNLTHLYLADTKLEALPNEFGHLQKLTILELGYTKFNAFPQMITQLKNLKVLDLSHTKITFLPEEIEELKNLITLDLSNSPLSTLPSEITKLKRLKNLYLSETKLNSLPKEIIKMKGLKELELYGSPLEYPPPEILEQGIEAIFEYMAQLPEVEDGKIVNEAKLIIVGQGEVGKTCLAKRLILDTFFENEETTEGIEISNWEIPAPVNYDQVIKLNVWDFGGQEIYHATHQFFLTKRSLYVLVWNARKSRDYEHIYYWLHTIEAFGEDSPIVLVMTKLNERDDDLNMKDLKERFPQIVGLFKVDSEDGRGIHTLLESIGRTAWNLPHMRTRWVNSWFNVRKRLEQDDRNWIDYQEFLNICQSEGLSRNQSDILDEYLHDLGIIIHFRDRIELKNMVILKPEWATNAVYKVLDTRSIRERQGVLLHSELESIWDVKVYPLNIFPKLLELMKRFELSYELPGKASHLVAELLPSTEPEYEWDDLDNLRFYYNYDFLPAGVMTRFIVLIHEELENQKNGKHLCWREGAVIKKEKIERDEKGKILKNQRGEISYKERTRALIKVKPDKKFIEIKIWGNNKRELLAVIRNHFDHIHRSIRKVKITPRIPCICNDGNCSYVFDYDKLIYAEQIGKEKVECQNSWKPVSLSMLLDGYERREKRLRDYKDKHKKRAGKGITYIDHSINIAGNISDSAISSHSKNVNQEIKSSKELLKLFERIIGNIKNDITLSKDDVEDILADIDNLKKEINKTPPKKRIIEAYLSNLGSIASITSLVQQIYPFLPAFLK